MGVEAMTKQDYELIARVIRNLRIKQEQEIDTIKKVIELLAAEFELDDKDFNAKLFYSACGWH